jgi:hypothetical protein
MGRSGASLGNTLPSDAAVLWALRLAAATIMSSSSAWWSRVLAALGAACAVASGPLGRTRIGALELSCWLATGSDAAGPASGFD